MPTPCEAAANNRQWPPQAMPAISGGPHRRGGPQPDPPMAVVTAAAGYRRRRAPKPPAVAYKRYATLSAA